MWCRCRVSPSTHSRHSCSPAAHSPQNRRHWLTSPPCDSSCSNWLAEPASDHAQHKSLPSPCFASCSVLQHPAWRRSHHLRGSDTGIAAGSGSVICRRQNHSAPFCDSVDSQQHQDPALQSAGADDPAPDRTGGKRPIDSEEKSG